MSIVAYRAVWEHSEAQGSARLVLLCLAEHADEDGRCWPSIPRISEMTQVSKRQVSRVLKQLEEDGEISYKPGDGRGNHSQYVILLPIVKGDMVSPNEPKKDDMVSERVTSHPEKDDTMSSEPSVNRKSEPSQLNGDHRFAEACTAYEGNIGMLTPIVSEKIRNAVDDHPDGWVVDAIYIAAEANKRSWRYVNGILRNWERQGYQDVNRKNGQKEYAEQATDEFGGYNV